MSERIINLEEMLMVTATVIAPSHTATHKLFILPLLSQLPGDVIAMLLGSAVAASSNEPISQLYAAVNVAVYSNGQILQLNAAYSNYTGVIYTSLTIYFMIQVPIFAAIFSAQRRGRCQIWWTAVIVSGLVSAAIIVALVVIFNLQFNLGRRRRQLRQQLRQQLGEEGLSVVAMTIHDRWTIVADAGEDVNDLDINWITQRAAFLLILMAISFCWLLSFTPLLCPHVQ